MTGDEIVARARQCVGAPFRAQGRRPEWGLDCIGLAAVATGRLEVPADYPLRGGSAERRERELGRAGFRLMGERRPGDLLVMQAGPGQLHLGILTDSGIVHADAGLRRVVERPGAVPWPLLSAWRVSEED